MRGVPLSAEQIAAFLRKFSHVGDLRKACEMSQISKSAVYVLRKTDEAFERQFQEALADARGNLVPLVQSRVMQLAIDGTEEYVVSSGRIVMDPETGEPLKQRRFYPAHSLAVLGKLMPEVFGSGAAQGGDTIPDALKRDPEPTPDEPAPANPIA